MRKNNLFSPLQPLRHPLVLLPDNFQVLHKFLYALSANPRHERFRPRLERPATERSESKRGAFLMKQEQTNLKRAKTITN